MRSPAPAQHRNQLTVQFEKWRHKFVSFDPKTMASTQQTIFCVVVMFPLIFLGVFARSDVRTPELILGSTILVVATLWVLLIRRDRLPKYADLVLPLIDLCAFGLVRWATLPDGAELSSLALAPALWMVVRYRGKGLLIGAIAIIVTITLPSLLIVSQLSILDVPRHLALPVTFIIISSLVLALFDRVSYQYAQVKQTQRLLRGVVNHLNVGVLVMDADGNDLLANASQQRIHNLVSPPDNPDPTEPGHLLFTLQGKSIPAEQRPARRVIHGETFDGVCMLAGPPAGHQRVLEVTSRIIEGHDQRVESRILVFDDVTETYNAQRAQEEIIATVSHELRTPLTSVLGYTDFAIETVPALPEAQRQELEVFLSVIERNAEKLLVRVEDLLVQQQARRGQLQLHEQDMSLEQLVQNAVQSQQARAAGKDIDLRIVVTEDITLWADPQRITQVLDNILANALDYTPRGGGVGVSVVRTYSPELQAVEAVVAVSDTGPGLTDAELHNLFAPFFRAPSSAASVPGTGLGLSLSKSIVEAHRGRLQVESTPGEGSTFSIHLPLYQENLS